MKASDLSESMIELMALMTENRYYTTTELAKEKDTRTIRKVLQRMVAFGVLDETVDPTNNLRRKAFRLTKEGRQLRNQAVGVPMVPNPNKGLVSWLRAMGEACHQMANQLEVYDEE
jgi:DNA-binding PadR family transcriptional regulator